MTSSLSPSLLVSSDHPGLMRTQLRFLEGCPKHGALAVGTRVLGGWLEWVPSISEV